MMKIVAVLMALVAVASALKGERQENQNLRKTQAVACFKHWTRAQSGTSGKQVFKGITNSTGRENYNNPLYYTLANAQKGFTATNLATGRFSGSLPTTNFVGTMTFDFFAGKDQIKISFTKSTGKGTISSGTGCYAGITGSASRKQIGTTTPKVFEWSFCPKVAPKCKPK